MDNSFRRASGRAKRRAPLLSAGAIFLGICSAPVAQAAEAIAPDVVAPAGGGFGAFGLKFAPGEVQVLSCAEQCKTGTVAYRVPLPEEAIKLRRQIQTVKSDSGALGLFVRFGSDDKFYSIVVRGPSTEKDQESAPRLLLKGWAGDKSERKTKLVVEKTDSGERLLLATSPELALCERVLPKMSKAYEPREGKFKSVRRSPLTSAELEKARRVVATPAASTEKVLFIALEKKDSRSSSAPVDGNLEETWVATHTFTELDFPEKAFERTLHLQMTEPAKDPRDVLVATDREVLRVEVPADPSLVYSVSLPEGAKCVAVVQSDPPSPLSEVMVAVPTEQETSTKALVARLEMSDPGFAEAALRLRGGEAGRALGRSFGGMSPLARGRATSIADKLPPLAALPIRVAALEHGNEEERMDALEHLKKNPKAAAEAVRARLPKSTPAAEAHFVDALIVLSPEMAVRALSGLLTVESGARRLHLRKALSRLGHSQSGEDSVFEYLRGLQTGSISLDAAAQVELLRAIGPRLEEWKAVSVPLLERLSRAADFERAYRLAPHVLALSAESPILEGQFRRWLSGGAVESLTARKSWALSVRCLELLEEERPKNARAFAKPAQKLLSSDNMRVRTAALDTASVLDWPENTEVTGRLLRKDEWPDVRAAAARALVAHPLSSEQAKETEEQLVRRLKRDDQIEVRVAIAEALSETGGPEALTALRRALEKDESYLVRSRAALSLGELCDERSLDALTKAARELARAPAEEGPVVLGLAAVTALVKMGPADLEQRLAPALSDKVAPPLRSQVQNRMKQGQKRGGSCASPSTPRS